MREQVKPYLDLQLVAFPQDGVLRPGAMDNLKRALDMGVDVVGGIPHFERTMQDGAESVRLLCELAAERGLRVDMHCDESDDPLSRHVETLAYHAQRLGLQGRVTGSHLTSMHSMDNYYVSKLIPLMREAGVSAIANPLINITLQGRHDSYPKRRGMTRVPELLAAGVPVAFGHDCVMDPWYSLGSGDMLEVAHMGLHVAQMTGQDAMRACFEAVTTTPARILGLDDTGLAVGKRADLVLLQARDAVEALRLRATRLMVLRGGQSSPKPRRPPPRCTCRAVPRRSASRRRPAERMRRGGHAAPSAPGFVPPYFNGMQMQVCIAPAAWCAVVHAHLEHGEVRRHLAAAGQPFREHPVVGLVHLVVRAGIGQDGAAALRDLEAFQLVAQVGVGRDRHAGLGAQLAGRHLLGVVQVHAVADRFGTRQAAAGGQHEDAREQRADLW